MGKVNSSAGSRPATADDFRMEQDVRQQLQQLSVPVLQRNATANEYLFFAFLDGTGQDRSNPRLGPATTVGTLYEQALAKADEPDSRIGAHYSRGIGSQTSAMARAWDGMLAHTWEDGIKDAYLDLAIQASAWVNNDPQAEIRAVNPGDQWPAGAGRGRVRQPLAQALAGSSMIGRRQGRSEGAMYKDRKLHGPGVLNVQDLFHDAQLLRDVAIINTQTIQALGALPPGGLPILP